MIHDAVGLGLGGAQVVVAVRILLDLLGGLAGVLGDGLVERLAPAQDFLGLAIAMSAVWPPAPPEGWWIITRLLGSAKRLPLVPAASSTVLMLAAMPMQ
jgi:hypothetical protein